MKLFSPQTLGLLIAIGLVTADARLAPLRAQPNSSLATTLTTSANANTLPPYILPSSPVAQVIRLVQAGVEESIVLSFVSNSISTFNLDSDKIIYLSDVGVTGNITTAMMQRDQVLQQQMAAAQTPPPPSPPPASTTAYTTDTPDATDSTDTTPPPAPDTEPVTVNYFYTSLAPYGGWVDVAGYGPCWRPTIGLYNPAWQPYCDRGCWVNTDGGWYWESDYAWGTTFHYGRWFRHPSLGWCWWPDTVWAPSWVTWRYSDDYCGWAPLPPFTVYQPGLGFIYRGNGISVGFDFGLAPDCFTFVPTERFGDPHPRRYRCAPDEISRIFTRTAVINNLSYNHAIVVNSGIPPQHFNRPGGAPIRLLATRDLRVPPSFTQHPVILRPDRPVTQPGQGFNGNYSNNRPVDRAPGQNYDPPSPAPYSRTGQEPPSNRPWSPAPASVQPAPRNYIYNNDPHGGTPVLRPTSPPPGQMYNHVPPRPMPEENASPRPGSPQIEPPPSYEHRDNMPSQAVPQASQPPRVEPAHVEPPPAQHPTPPTSQSSQSGQKQNKY